MLPLFSHNSSTSLGFLSLFFAIALAACTADVEIKAFSDSEPDYLDLDGDGYGVSSAQPGPRVSKGGDCNDNNFMVHPNAQEICNLVDDNCDALIDEADPSLVDGSLQLTDEDGDGFGSEFVLSCTENSHIVAGDCNDSNNRIYPGAPEICNGLDDDCDGLVDAFDLSLVDGERVLVDYDGDGFGGPTTIACESNTLAPGDCDDARNTVFPGATEHCNGLDDDCDGLVDTLDSSLVDGVFIWRDADLDGFGGEQMLSCVSNNVQPGDCDDNNSTVFPGAVERCNGVDDDCDGEVDLQDPDLVDAFSVFQDLDGDGFGAEVVSSCVETGTLLGDCDDNNKEVFPDAVERCNEVDDNCDGRIDLDDPALVGAFTTYADLDNDGFGTEQIQTCTISDVVLGDCDDDNSDIHPNALERCNGLDDDCDGLVDALDDSLSDGVLSYIDLDGDGYGGSFTVACDAGEVLPNDCDETNFFVNPGVLEVCNEVDDNCDGKIDEGLAVATRYLDFDNDGFGVDVDGEGCERPPWSFTPGDCDDSDPQTYPNAPESCDGVDEDCDKHPDLPDVIGDHDTLGCDLCPSIDETPEVHSQTYNPCLLDDEAIILCRDNPITEDTHESGERLHTVYRRADTTQHKDGLIVYYPPAEGVYSQVLARWMAEAGHKVLVMEFSTFPGSAMKACRAGEPEICVEEMFLELLDGTDAYSNMEIGYANSMEGEVSTLLAHLASEEVEQGWEKYLVDGVVDWSNVHLVSWSRGSGAGAMVARERELKSFTMFATRIDLEKSPWLYSEEFLTRDARVRAITHPDEYAEFNLQVHDLAVQTGWYVDTVVDFDTQSWPWLPKTGVFTTSSGLDLEGCHPHNWVADDRCLDQEAARQPYRDYFCTLDDPAFLSPD